MAGENENEELQEELSPEEVEREARNMGWVPLEQFKGNKAHWADAATFVEKGKHVLPIMQQNNRRLQAELLKRDEKLDILNRQLEGATTAIEKLEAHYTEANRRAVQQAKTNLIAELREARESNDVEAEQRILGQLDDVRVREREADAQPTEKKSPAKKEAYTDNLSDDFKSWQAENDWYGKDTKRTKAYVRLAEDMREEGNQLTGREFIEAVDAEYKRLNSQSDDDTDTRSSSKVEGGAHRGSGNSSKKGWNSLPADAKQACLQDQHDLVGPDKRYKTLDAWKDAYAKIYYAEG